MSDIQVYQNALTDGQIKTLAQAGVIPAETPAPIVAVFAETSRQHNLSPFKREIYLVRYGNQYNTIVGIDGLRTKAGRTGAFAGRDDAKFDVQPDGSFKTAAQLKAINATPISCTVTVYAAIAGVRCPFTKTVLFAEYCPANKQGKWASMPFNMIEKCAEAAALRMAFAAETAGLHIEEESAAMQDITIQAAEKTPSVAIDVTELENRIADCWTAETLSALYNEKKEHADYAALFSARKQELITLKANGQI